MIFNMFGRTKTTQVGKNQCIGYSVGKGEDNRTLLNVFRDGDSMTLKLPPSHVRALIKLLSATLEEEK